MVKVYVVGLPETAPVTLFWSVNIALMVADTVCPEVPMYVQVRLNVASWPAGREPDNVLGFPLGHVTEYVTVPVPRVGSLLSGVLVKLNAVIFGMLETSRVSPVSPQVVDLVLPLATPAGWYVAVQK